MLRNAIITSLAILLILGVAIFFGIRAVQNWKTEEAENTTSTSTEAKAGWKGFFGVLRNEYFSKKPFQREDSGFQLKWPWSGGGTSGSEADPREEAGTGFVLRRGEMNPSSNTSRDTADQVSAPRPSPRPSQIPYGFTTEELSPFFGEVTMTSVQPPRKSDYDRTSISLMADIGISRPVNITRWKIKTHSGETLVPQAIERYVPGSSVAGDIMLGSGQTLFLFGPYRFAEYQHPFGKNIRLNRCTGYLNNLYPFDPKLPEQCPKVQKEKLRSLSGSCQTFFLQFGTCKAPTSEQINSAFSGDSACQAFARNTFGYGLCYATHKNDENFLSNEWYAWTRPQAQIPFARDHDRVLLLDTEGLLVDELSY